MPKLTKKFIENEVQAPVRGQIVYRDTDLPGFGLRVTRGSASYIVERRVNGINRRITVGQHGPMSPALARKEAHKLLARMAIGHDPVLEASKRKVANVTLEEVMNRYLSARTLRPNSVRSFTSILSRCLGDWLLQPITSITKEMVEARHRSLTKVTHQGSPGKAQANIAMERLNTLINFAADTYEIDGQSIISSNPVRRLTQIRAWHKLSRRQTVIPDHKLARWYQAVKYLKNTKIRDYLLLLLFTGLRRVEAASLLWTDIDFETRVLTVRAAFAKNNREHRLPISDFLFELLAKRKREAGSCDFIFPGQKPGKHMVDFEHVLARIIEDCGCPFMISDLRRNFLTAAERLDVPHYALRKLANHVSVNDVTEGYLVVGVERLRGPMQKISEHFLALMDADVSDLDEIIFY